MDDDRRDALLHQLLGPLHMHFRCARAAYAAYLNDGKRFLFASSLKRLNLSARGLLLEHGHRLPEALQAEAAALIGHYDAWLTLWDAHAQATRPGPEDEFAFENRFTYPKDAEAALEALYRELSAGA
jgi:hypothetical protein